VFVSPYVRTSSEDLSPVRTFSEDLSVRTSPVRTSPLLMSSTSPIRVRTALPCSPTLSGTTRVRETRQQGRVRTLNGERSSGGPHQNDVRSSLEVLPHTRTQIRVS